MSPKLLLLLSLLCCSLSVGTARMVAAQAAVEPGAGFHVVRYDLELIPNLQSKSLSGAEVITFRSLTEDLRTVVFSGNALTIDSATMNAKAVQVSTTPQAISLELPENLKQEQTAKLRIAYHGTPKQGVTFTPTSIYTSYAACDWMICSEDAPGDKAIFALSLHVPSGMTSIASGKQIGRSKSGDGEIDRWRTMIPYSAYLYDFAIGKLASTSTRQSGVELVYMSDVATAP